MKLTQSSAQVVMITPVSFNNINNQTYTIFAIINALMVPSVYFFFPETAYRSLEEMDTIFHKVHGLRGALTVVRQAEIEPRRYGKKGEMLINFEDVDDKANTEHHAGNGNGSNSSDGAGPMFTEGDEEAQREKQAS
jgi:hypothetical protein